MVAVESLVKSISLGRSLAQRKGDDLGGKTEKTVEKDLDDMSTPRARVHIECRYGR